MVVCNDIIMSLSYFVVVIIILTVLSGSQEKGLVLE